MQKRCRCKNTMQKNANHWSDLLFVRFFLHCCFAVFFCCFCLVFFCLFVHLPRLLQLFPEIMFVQLVPGLICFFFSFFLLFAQVFQLFSEIMFVQLAPGLICCFFLHVFAFLFFAPFRVAFFNCVFFFFFCICSFCFSRVCTPHLHVFCFISIFFQVENLLERAQFDNTMFTVFPLQKKRDTNHQAAARTQPRVAESLSLFPPTKSHQM